MLTFDNALPVFAGIVRDALGDRVLREYFFLRDVSGRLTFIVPDGFDPEKRREIAARACERVRPYVDDGDMSVASPSDLFDDRLVSPKDCLTIRVNLGDTTFDVRVVDRRMVGADWVRNPESRPLSGKRLAFTSLKGGVGRTTALCVLAADLVAEGKRVLVVDLDLEAPGLGNMLLNDRTLPRYGMLDYLVERNLSQIDEHFLDEMVGSSWLGSGRGLLDVVPALGRMSTEFPENVLGKIARAYLAASDSAGKTTTFADHVGQAIDSLSTMRNYDAILIDARAGLHETTAASILGLGARVLCFGLDQPQTYADYKLLFAHLATVRAGSDSSPAARSEAGERAEANISQDEASSRDGRFEWSDAMIMVQGKAPATTRSQESFAQRMMDLFRNSLPEGADPLAISVGLEAVERDFDVDWDVTAIEAVPLPEEQRLVICRILNDDRYTAFDPLSDQDALDQAVYQTTYGPFIDVCRTALELGRDSD